MYNIHTSIYIYVCVFGNPCLMFFHIVSPHIFAGHFRCIPSLFHGVGAAAGVAG